MAISKRILSAQFGHIEWIFPGKYSKLHTSAGTTVISVLIPGLVRDHQKKKKESTFQYSIKININQYKSMKINENRKSLKTAVLIFVDFQYHSINCYWFLLTIIDVIDY